MRLLGTSIKKETIPPGNNSLPYKNLLTVYENKWTSLKIVKLVSFELVLSSFLPLSAVLIEDQQPCSNKVVKKKTRHTHRV